MDHSERERMVADAILAERAARMLERRHPEYLRVSACSVIGFLGRVARELREEAGYGVPPA